MSHLYQAHHSQQQPPPPPEGEPPSTRNLPPRVSPRQQRQRLRQQSQQRNQQTVERHRDEETMIGNIISPGISLPRNTTRRPSASHHNPHHVSPLPIRKPSIGTYRRTGSSRSVATSHSASTGRYSGGSSHGSYSHGSNSYAGNNNWSGHRRGSLGSSGSHHHHHHGTTTHSSGRRKHSLTVASPYETADEPQQQPPPPQPRDHDTFVRNNRDLDSSESSSSSYDYDAQNEPMWDRPKTRAQDLGISIHDPHNVIDTVTDEDDSQEGNAAQQTRGWDLGPVMSSTRADEEALARARRTESRTAPPEPLGDSTLTTSSHHSRTEPVRRARQNPWDAQRRRSSNSTTTKQSRRIRLPENQHRRSDHTTVTTEDISHSNHATTTKITGPLALLPRNGEHHHHHHHNDDDGNSSTSSTPSLSPPPWAATRDSSQLRHSRQSDEHEPLTVTPLPPDDAATTPSQQSLQQQKKLIVAACIGCCLLGVVITGTILFTVLGTYYENQNNNNNNNNNNVEIPPPASTAVPTILANPNDTTVNDGTVPEAAGTTAPSITTDVATSPPPWLEPGVLQWAQSNLPPETLARITFDVTNTNTNTNTNTEVTTRPGTNIGNDATNNNNNNNDSDAGSVSPQTRALQWLQSDPFFVEALASSRDTPRANNSVATARNGENREWNDPQQPPQLRQRLVTRFSLATLYFATRGNVWTESMRDSTSTGNLTTEWLSSDDECSWPRYTCRNDANGDLGSTRVRRLDVSRPPTNTTVNRPTTLLQLSNLPVAGTIPAEIALLSSLTVLEVYSAATDGNVGLTGTLPSELGRLTDLTILDLHHNRLTGTLPSELGQLTRLEALFLQHNSFTPGSVVPAELCALLEAPEAVLQTISVDCSQVTCSCGCQCVSTNSTSEDGSANNIFHHEDGPPASSSSPPTGSTNSTPSATLYSTDVNDTLTQANVTATTTVTGVADALLCNGLANICDRRLPEVLFGMVHNAMASQADGFVLGNHVAPLEEALHSGYRGINLDVCRCGGELVLCHGVCELGTRDIVEVFQNMNQFLQDNPFEVLQVPLQFNNDISGTDAIDIFELYGKIQQVGTNFTDMLYIHAEVSPWPTLRTLIETNKRLVMFHFNGPTCREPGSCPEPLHYYFDYVAETEFQLGTVQDLLDVESSCRVTRGGNGQHRSFLGVNNFLQLPSRANAPTLNSLEFLASRVSACSAANENKAVSFLYVDFWGIGDVVEYVKIHNMGLVASADSIESLATARAGNQRLRRAF